MNNNLQLVLKSSTTEMSLNDHDAGIYIVPELDGLTGLPEIRTTSGVNAGYDGGWTSAQKFDARSIVIRGVIANEDKTEVERMRRELVALLAQGKNEQLELDFVTETGRAYEAQVRTIACDMAMQRVLTQQEFMITLRADDPLIYDNSSAGEEATVNVSGATGGFRIPFEIPLAIDAGSEETVVQNSGLESVAPTIKMYGALHNPKIINHTTNQAMQIEAELGFTEGAWTTPVDAPEGANVSFEPEREAPIESAKLKGETSQNGTPTPDAPVAVQTVTGENVVKITGKNLFHVTAGSHSGITTSFDSSTGEVVYAGTATTQWPWLGAKTPIKIPSGTTITFSSEDPTRGYWLRLYYDGSNYENCNISASSKKYTKTTSHNIIAMVVLINCSVGDAINERVKLQLEKSSSATDYEPYQEQSYDVSLYGSKNIFDKDNAPELKAYINGQSITYYQNPVSTYIKIKPNTTYTITKPILTNNRFAVGTSPTVPVASGTLTNATQDNSAGSLTITSGEADKYLMIYFKQGNDTTPNATIFSQIQVEKGSTATSYESYSALELCGLGDDGTGGYLYKDGIYKNLTDNKWYVHKVIGSYIATGDENISIYDSSQIPMIYIPNNEALQGSSNTLLSTHFIYEWANNIGACYVSGVKNMIACGVDGVTTVDGAKTWLSSNKPKFVYILATPTDTEITNETLVAQLEALVDGNAVVYEGKTNIVVTAADGDLPGIAAIRYYTDKEPDQRDELIVDSRLKTITLNGLDVYHLQAPGSEFLMLAPGENKLSLQSDITGDNGYAKVSYKQGYLSI